MVQTLTVKWTCAKDDKWVLTGNGTSNGDDLHVISKASLVSAVPLGTESVVVDGVALSITSSNAGTPRRIRANLAYYYFVGGFSLAINSYECATFAPLGIRLSLSEIDYALLVSLQESELNDIIYASMWGHADTSDGPTTPAPVSLESYRWPLKRAV